MEVLAEGAWTMVDIFGVITLAEGETAHDIFEAHLASRCDGSLEDLDMEIPEEGAWGMLPSGTPVADDELTAYQQSVQDARDKRTNLGDPSFMTKRRQELAKYFGEDCRSAKNGRLNREKVDPFLAWADNMQESWERFQKLCED